MKLTRPPGLSTGSLCLPPLEVMAPSSLPTPQAQPSALEESLQLSLNTGRPGGGCKPGASSWLLTEEWPELRAACSQISWSKKTRGLGGCVSGCLAGLCLWFKNRARVPAAGTLRVSLTVTPLPDWSSSPGLWSRPGPFLP